MHLDELAVGILRALLITSGNCAAGANHRVGRLAENQTWTAGGDDHGVGRKRFQFECLQIHRDQSATNLVIVEHQRQHFPVLKLSTLPSTS